MQRAGDPQPPRALRRRHPTRQRQLIGDPTPDRPRVTPHLALLDGHPGAGKAHTHRRLRGRLIRESALDEIPGIGPAKKAALLTRFGSVYRLARATSDAIAAVPGIGRTLADAILRAVRPPAGRPAPE